MKNEPVVTYNHMQDDGTSVNHYFVAETENNRHPISLYMIFAIDILLMGAIGFLAYQIIF